jgi:formate hydrogenlyase subunit 3/multisubunit Na+/H+ antiporter MnhD subunit
MTVFSVALYLQVFLKLNFFFFSMSTILISIFYFLFSYKNINIKFGLNFINFFFKFINIVCYLVSFILFLISFFLFFKLIECYQLDNNLPSSLAFSKKYNIFLFSYRFEIDIFGFILLLLAYAVGFLSLLTLDTRLSQINFNFFIYFNFFIIIVFFFVIVNDIVLFFFFYELLLLPSFFFVYYISYSKKALQASLYFVI